MVISSFAFYLNIKVCYYPAAPKASGMRWPMCAGEEDHAVKKRLVLHHLTDVVIDRCEFATR